MKNLSKISNASSILILALSASVLAGWVFNIEVFRTSYISQVPMRVNTALCFGLAGLAIILLNLKLKEKLKGNAVNLAIIALASLVFIAGALTMAEYLFTANLGIDQLFLKDAIQAHDVSVYFGRMSPIPALNFVLTGIIIFILLYQPEYVKTYQLLGIIILFNALFAGAIHLYHDEGYFDHPDFASISLNAALGFVMLSLSIFFIYPEKGGVGILSAKGFTGLIAWQLAPFLVIIPLVMGIVWLEGQQASWGFTRSGTLLFASIFLIAIIAIVIGTVRYINSMERKFQIHEKSAHLASIVNYSEDAIISTSLDGIIQSWNRGAEKMFGYTPEEAIGQHTSLIYPHEVEDDAAIIFNKLKEGHAVEHYETIRKRKDGEYINISLTISPLKDQAGVITGTSKIARDVTEKRKLEAALEAKSYYLETRINEILEALLKFTTMDFSTKIAISDKGDELDAIGIGLNTLCEELENHIHQIKASATQVQTIFDHTPNGMVVIDEEGKIQQWNPKAEAIFGWTSQEIEGKYLHELIIPVHLRHKGDKGITHFTENNGLSSSVAPVEMTAINKDGQEFNAEMSFSTFKTLNSPNPYYIVTINDITERKVNEELHLQYIKQVAQNKELESFAYIASHDLKAPLRSISHVANWLLEDYGDKLDDTGRSYLNMLIDRMKRLEALINGILAYSKAGRVTEERKETDFNELLEEVKEMIGPEENVVITKMTPLPVMKTARTAMTQVFTNLISNAIKHNDKEHPEVKIGCTNGGRWWTFYVSDNGPGIDKKYQDGVFQIFQTLNRQSDKDSTGIGLGIVKRILESEGGKVWLESEPGKGATFYFTVKKDG